MEMKIVGSILCLVACILIGAVIFAVTTSAVSNAAAITGGLFAAILLAGGSLYLGDKP